MNALNTALQQSAVKEKNLSLPHQLKGSITFIATFGSTNC